MGLDERFECTVFVRGPYYFPEFARTTASDEQAAIDTGAIQAGATCFVGRNDVR